MTTSHHAHISEHHLAVTPDLSFVIGAGQAVRKLHLSPSAVPWNSTMHHISAPLAMAVFVGVAAAPVAFGPLALVIGGLSWMAHIALDRVARYGLRTRDGSRNRT